MQVHPNVKLIIEGHTSKWGEALSKKLSRKRSQASLSRIY